MRKLISAVVTTLAVLSLTAGGALAATPTSIQRDGGLHFVGQPTVTATITSESAYLSASGEVAGAGQFATATLTATALVTRGCINRGSKNQEPSGLQRSTETTVGSQTFETRSGRGSFSFNTTAITVGDFDCPDGMTPTLVSVTFTDITLTVTSNTGTTTATYADISG